MAAKKEVVLFYLNRYVKLAEARASFDHEAAAKRGMPYDQRQKMVADAEDAKQEHEAMEKAYEIVNNHDGW
jgi:hypothetical protein